MAKLKGLAGLRESMEKRYGTERVVKRETARKLDVIPTGSVALDYALRTGGWPRGRLSEVVGQPGMSKSTLVLSSMAQAQKVYPDLAVGYVDMEHTWTFEWAEANGIDTSEDRLMYTKPRHTEDVSDQIREMMLSSQFSLIVVDSVGGMESAKAMYDKTAEESTMGKNAQVISRMCKQIAVIADETNTAVLFVNQYRANFSGMGGPLAAGPQVLKYATTLQVALSRASNSANATPYLTTKVQGDDIEYARQFKAKVVRNKLAPAGSTAEYWLHTMLAEGNEIGIDKIDEVVVVGKKTGVIKGTGWLHLPNGERFQGAPAAKRYLREHPEVVADLRERVLASVAEQVEDDVKTEFVEESNA